MKTIWAMLASTAALAVIVVGAILNAGCEEGTNTKSLTLSPASSTLSDTGSATVVSTNGTTNVTGAVAGQSVVFTVTSGLQDLSLPLVWSVSNPNLGTIEAQGGISAVYGATSGQHGVNSVTVRDQYGAMGVAQVDQ